MLINLEYLDRPITFGMCVKALKLTFDHCEEVDPKRYILMKDVANLLDATLDQATSFVIQSELVHGFVFNKDIYVHPTAISNHFMHELLVDEVTIH